MFRININRMQMSDIDFQIQKEVLARFSLKKTMESSFVK